MDQITVKELYQICLEAIRQGHGDKNIVISDDNEGNGYHGLFFGLSPIDPEYEGYFKSLIYDSKTDSMEDTIILG